MRGHTSESISVCLISIEWKFIVMNVLRAPNMSPAHNVRCQLDILVGRGLTLTASALRTMGADNEEMCVSHCLAIICLSQFGSDDIYTNAIGLHGVLHAHSVVRLYPFQQTDGATHF